MEKKKTSFHSHMDFFYQLKSFCQIDQNEIVKEFHKGIEKGSVIIAKGISSFHQFRIPFFQDFISIQPHLNVLLPQKYLSFFQFSP